MDYIGLSWKLNNSIQDSLFCKKGNPCCDFNKPVVNYFRVKLERRLFRIFKLLHL